MKEARVQKLSVEYLRDHGCLCIKLTTLGRYGKKGWPDYLVLLPKGASLDRVWFIEFKAGGEKPTPLQRLRIRTLREFGFTVSVIDDPKKTETLHRLMTGGQ